MHLPHRIFRSVVAGLLFVTAGCGPRELADDVEQLEASVSTQTTVPSRYHSFARTTALTTTSLPVNGGPRVVFTLPASALVANEFLKITSEVEVTNDVITGWSGSTDQYANVSVTGRVVLATSPTATSGTEIAPVNGLYFDGQIHHVTIPKSAVLPITANLGDRHVNVVLTATDPRGPYTCYSRLNDTPSHAVIPCGIKVEKLSFLSVHRFSPVPATGRTAFQAAVTPTANLAPAISKLPYQPYASRRVVLSRDVGVIRTGDVIEATAELQASLWAQVTANPACVSMLAGQLLLSESPTAISGPALSSDTAYNLTAGNKYSKLSKRGSFKATAEYGQRYLNLVAWASPNSYCTSDTGLPIELDRSDLSAVIYRAAQPGAAHQALAFATNTPRITALHITGTQPWALHYSQSVGSVLGGDLLAVNAETQLSTSWFSPNINSALFVGDTATATGPLRVGNFPWDRFSPRMNHLPLPRGGAVRLCSNCGGAKFVTLGLKGTNQDGAPAGTQVTVDGAGYGRLSVERYTPAPE